VRKEMDQVQSAGIPEFEALTTTTNL